MLQCKSSLIANGYLIKFPAIFRYVIIGSSRSSWGFGATGASAGTAVLMDLATSISKTMTAYGWRPRRTLIFVSFAASEFSNIGAKEWVEEHLPLLKNRVVSFINVDSCVSGKDFDSTASISLRKLFTKALKSIPDPFSPLDNRRKYFDYWKEKFGGYNRIEEAYTNYIGSQGDYESFVFQGTYNRTSCTYSS